MKEGEKWRWEARGAAAPMRAGAAARRLAGRRALRLGCVCLHIAVLLCCWSRHTGAELRYGYNDNGVALHWNEISARPAWPAYPVQPAVVTSLEELHNQGVKMLRVRVRGSRASTSGINSDGVATESSLALARSTQEATGTGEWTKARPCGEIDFLLRSCLDASQTDGVPNSSRCYWAPTPEEAVACWCRVCDFQRAIEICSVSNLFNKCDACQMGRSLQDWTQSRCPAGGALTVRVNALKGRSGVSEERWHGDVREIAQARLDAQALQRLHGGGGYGLWGRVQGLVSFLLLVGLFASVVMLAMGVPSATILSAWVTVVHVSVVVACKAAEGTVCLCCYVLGRAPPGALMQLLRKTSESSTEASQQQLEGFISAASSLTSTPTKPVRAVRTCHSGYASAASSLTSSPAKPARLNALRACSAASTDGEGSDAGEDGFLTARAWGDDSHPSSPAKAQLRSAFRKLLSSQPAEPAAADEADGSVLSAVGEESVEASGTPSTLPREADEKPKSALGARRSRHTF